jgi:hypothetical protein
MSRIVERPTEGRTGALHEHIGERRGHALGAVTLLRLRHRQSIDGAFDVEATLAYPSPA